jgi:hypothetical protein
LRRAGARFVVAEPRLLQRSSYGAGLMGWIDATSIEKRVY